jgi:hypothetical protein
MELIEFRTEDVISAFDVAVNLNSGLKRAIKDSGRGNPEFVSFAKRFRDVVSRGRKADRDAFIERHLVEAAGYFCGIAGSVLKDKIMEIAKTVIDRYADEFNNTYRHRADRSIEILSASDFDRIVSSAYRDIGEGLIAQELPDSKFTRTVVLSTLFVGEVWLEVQKRGVTAS